MKKVLVVLAVLLALGLGAQAAMEARDFTASVVGTKTNTASYTLRGELQGVYVIVPSGGTGTVTVASAEQTLFTKSVTATAYFPILVPAYGTTGAALTFVSGTNDTACPYYKPAVMAGPVTMTVVGANGAAVTNSWTARVIFNP